MQRLFFFILILSAVPMSCNKKVDKKPEKSIVEEHTIVQGYSLMNKPLIPQQPSEKLLSDFQKRKERYKSDTSNVNHLIWYGRFAAYKGDYLGAIDIYTNGIRRFPMDARLYRHRGHRNISLRKFDAAIADLEIAAQLIRGKKNKVEPDGMPNARNIPVSTLHGNIWYHLGLAYYLKQDFPNALRAYEKCLATGTNPDNIVSSTHWLYMIAMRMGDVEKANAYLEGIQPDMDVIENMSYHRNCLFYKGLLSEKDFISDEGSFSSIDASKYALGNWYLYNGNEKKAREIFQEMVESDGWNSFGYIAAEADLVSIDKN